MSNSANDIASHNRGMLTIDGGSMAMVRLTDGRFLTMVAALLGSVALSHPALAQTAAGERDGGLVDPAEIIVTAQRRQQSLQDVPISVTALTGGDLSTAGISGTERLSQVTPGLNFTRNRFFSQPYIRGVGSSSTSIGDEPSVATYVDGIYMSGVQQGFMDFLNVDRVEVLKGPQGTLFGRNATGGAINIVTRLPSFDPELQMRASYGRFNEVTLQGYGATGIGEGAAIGLAASWDRRDGFLKDLVANRKTGHRDGYILRGRLRLEPSDELRIILSADVSKRDDAFSNNYSIINRNSRAETGTPPINTTMGDYEIRRNFVNTSLIKQHGFSAEITYEAEPFSIISTSSYRHIDFGALVDSDSTESLSVVSAFNQNNSGRDIQQEIRLISNPDSKIEWLAGMFYFDSETSYDPLEVISARLVLNSKYRTKALAFFADATVPLGGGFSVSVGGRYSTENKKLRQSVFLQAAGLTRQIGPRKYDEENFSPRGVFSFEPNEDNLFYVSYSRGFKTGGYNQSGLGFLGGFPDPAFLPEKINAYEAGFKRTLRGALRGTFNVAGFHYDYSDLQVQIVTPPPQGSGTAVIQNASGLKIDGIEADLSLYFTSRFTVRLAGSYLDAKYTKFPNAIVNVPRPCPAGVPACGNDTVIADVSGNQAVKAPRWTGNLSATYKLPLSNGYSLNLSGNAYYNSGFPWEPSGRLREGSYTVVNAQIELSAPNDRWTVALYGRNLTDERYYGAVQLDAQSDRGLLADPVTYGITVGYKL